MPYYSDFSEVGVWELYRPSQVSSHMSNSIFNYTLTCPDSPNSSTCKGEQPFPAFITGKNFILYFRAKVNTNKTTVYQKNLALYGIKFRIEDQRVGSYWLKSYWVTYNLEKRYRPILIDEIDGVISPIPLFDGNINDTSSYPISEHFKDYDEWNEYLIVSKDSGFDLYINGSHLDNIPDTNIDESGYYSFYFQVNRNQTLSVDIDNYVLWILPEEEQ